VGSGGADSDVLGSGKLAFGISGLVMERLMPCSVILVRITPDAVDPKRVGSLAGLRLPTWSWETQSEST